MPPIIAAVATGLTAIAGVAAATAATGLFLGITAVGWAAITVGLSIAGTLLAPKPKSPKNSPENANRLRASIDTRTPRKTWIGITAGATDIRDEEFNDDDQSVFHRFIVCAAHKVEAINQIWFDDKLAWAADGGVNGEFVNYLTVQVVTEGNAGNAIDIGPRMATSRLYTGCAYVYLRYLRKGLTKKVESPFASNITTRITIRGKGAPFYDPRLDDTVEGGVGDHRADDQDTWEWDDGACRNPALALLFYLLGYRIQNPETGEWRLSVGKNIPASRIDLESFAIAANICDEPIAIPAEEGGGFEPRYAVSGVWSEGDSPTTVIDMLKASMNADLDDLDGKLRLTILRDDTLSADADFTDEDIIGAFEWQAQPPLSDSFNVVRGIFTDNSDEALYQTVDYPEVRDDSPDGIDRIHSLNLPMVESPRQARRLAALRLQRQRFPGTFKAEMQATAWRVQRMSVCRLTFAPRGWVNKVFRVAELEARIDGVVPVVLREEDPSIYTAPPAALPILAIPPTSHDPFKDAFVELLLDYEDLAINFDDRNDRLEGPIVAPTIAGDGTAIDHVLPGDGSASVSFEWSWSGSEAELDGFEVSIYATAASTPYVMDSTPDAENRLIVLPHVRAFFFHGLPMDRYYTFGVRAFRVVDPDIDPDQRINSAWAQSAASGENPYRPASNIAFDGDLIGTIDGEDASVVAEAVGNFNLRNDRDNSVIADAVILTDGSAVDHVDNSNGTVDVSFEWTWSGSNEDIDFWDIVIVKRASATAYTINSSPSIELLYRISPEKRAFFVIGGRPNDYYTFYVRAGRIVDPDVDIDGVIYSGWVKPSLGAENPYRPAANIAFAGDITGTVNGVAASTVTTAVSNFNGRNDRLATAIPSVTIATDGTAVDHVLNNDGSADISLEWTWSGSEADIDGWEVLVYSSTSSSAYTVGTTAAAELVTRIPVNRRAFILTGVTPNLYYTFAVRGYRVVDPDVAGNVNGFIYGSWVKPSLAGENPYRPAANAAFAGNITGTVDGLAATFVSAAINPSTGNIAAGKVVTGSIGAGAINFADWIRSGASIFVNNETWELPVTLTAFSISGSRTILRLAFTWQIEIDDPTNGEVCSFTLRGYLENSVSGVKTYSTDTWTASGVWNEATTTGTKVLGKNWTMLEFTFESPTPADYTAGFELVVPASFILGLYPHRYTRLEDLRAIL